MSASTKLLNAGRDVTARVAWYLPHDARRSLYFRARPSMEQLYQTMRANHIDEVPGLSVSLLPFDTHRCIFVHVPKNGGTSIGRSLFGEYRGNHMPIRSYQMIYSKADFESYFKFGFVRNPFDRLLSAYHYARNGADRIDGAEAAGKVSSKPSLARAVAPYDDFEHFVTDWVSPANARMYEHFRPQHRFVCSPTGSVQLDHVGRFETIDEDFEAIAERLGVSTDLMHDRRSRRAEKTESYVDQYTPATRRIAADVFERDLRLFDYSFGD